MAYNKKKRDKRYPNPQRFGNGRLNHLDLLGMPLTAPITLLPFIRNLPLVGSKNYGKNEL